MGALMGLETTFNPAIFEARLNQKGERAIKGMSDRMRRTAIRIRDLAREYAPVKSGLLEKSIDYITLRDARNRNAYIIYIDLDALRTGKRQGRLGDYAWIMHSQLRPFGNKGKPRHDGPRGDGPRKDGPKQFEARPPRAEKKMMQKRLMSTKIRIKIFLPVPFLLFLLYFPLITVSASSRS